MGANTGSLPFLLSSKAASFLYVQKVLICFKKGLQTTKSFHGLLTKQSPSNLPSFEFDMCVHMEMFSILWDVKESFHIKLAECLKKGTRTLLATDPIIVKYNQQLLPSIKLGPICQSYGALSAGHLNSLFKPSYIVQNRCAMTSARFHSVTIKNNFL